MAASIAACKRGDIRVAQQGERDSSTYTLTIEGGDFAVGFKKSDIGYRTMKALDDKGLIDQSTFDFLRADKTCTIMLLKTKDEVTPSEIQYRKYRVEREAELNFNGVGYYVARDWGVISVGKFISLVESRFPSVIIQNNNV